MAGESKRQKQPASRAGEDHVDRPGAESSSDEEGAVHAQSQVDVESSDPRVKRRDGEHRGERIQARRRRVPRRRGQFNDNVDQMMEETTDLARAITDGYLSMIETTADIVASFAAVAADRDRYRRRRTRGDDADSDRDEFDDRDELDAYDDEFTDSAADEYEDAPEDDLPRQARRAVARPRSRRDSPRLQRGRRRRRAGLADLPGNLVDALAEAWEDAIEGPGRVFDEFHDSYHDRERPLRRT